ncbi:uncharacterized protein BJX67DRAFT_371940 [Aspergillus lucknowensis]|uniref:PARP catalytic domain-containing protein n=1 Tax=Aspergillus lucknowensis TaxID=176173 RepID=A0ABR4LSV0_9EURO
MFQNEWKHPNTKAKLVSIYVIKNTKRPGLKLTFHGTQRACKIGAGSLDPCDKDECYLCCILKKGFTLDHANPRAMFGPGIYSSVISSKADIYAKNHHIHCHKHVLILCGVDLGTPKVMQRAGLPGKCDSVEGATRPEGGTLEYPETVIYDPARIKPIGLVLPEEYSLPASPVDEDVCMVDADPSTFGDEAADETATTPLRRVQVIERHPADSQRHSYSEGPSYQFRSTDEITTRATAPPRYEPIAPRATVHQPSIQEPTEMKMSWTDRNKSPHVEGIFLFDVKSVPPRLEGQPQPTVVSASKDVELLSSLIELPLSFHGARRACYLGDLGYPPEFCDSDKCSICMVFRNQYALRESRIGFTLWPRIFASPCSSQADAFVTNHHIRSPQHAMVLCACPSIVSIHRDTFPTTPGAPPAYSATTSSCEIVVPIGLIIYTRRGWHPP